MVRIIRKAERDTEASERKPKNHQSKVIRKARDKSLSSSEAPPKPTAKIYQSIFISLIQQTEKIEGTFLSGKIYTFFHQVGIFHPKDL